MQQSQDKISSTTDIILEDVKDWLHKPLKPIYIFVFVDCIYCKKDKGMAQNQVVYVMLGIDVEGRKDVIGLHTAPIKSKSAWMNIFDSIRLDLILSSVSSLIVR